MNTKTKFMLIGSLVIIGLYLLFEHRIHLLGNSQYLLLGLFILLHLFMHVGHGGHKEQKNAGHHER